MKYPLLPLIVTAIAAVSFCSSPPARTDSASGAADTQHRGRYKYVTPAEGLRLREGPDLKATTIMSLPFNSRVKVIETTQAAQEIGEMSTGWTKVEFATGNRTVTGWMYDGYLSFQRALAPSLYGEFAVHKCYPAKGWETSAVDYGSKMTGKQYFTIFRTEDTSRPGCSFVWNRCGGLTTLNGFVSSYDGKSMAVSAKRDNWNFSFRVEVIDGYRLKVTNAADITCLTCDTLELIRVE